MPDWLEALQADWAWPDLNHVGRILAAVVLGGLIGLEREVRDKPAGFRTIMLICLGACIFSLLSEAVGGADYERTRIAAQIVSGIGFLGAGAILRDRHGIFGLTTAATIWAVAAVGMAAGFGRLGLATVGAFAILSALYLFDAIEQWVGDRRDIQEYDVKTANSDDSLRRINALFARAGLHVRKCTYYEEGESLNFHVVAMGAKPNHADLRFKLARSDDYTLRRS
jgi:putative Mg2+ transporter-C (MgtC) family protein